MNTQYSETDAQRFWSYVDQSGGPDGCWLWLRSRNSKGYGQFWISGRLFKAHRFAWVICSGQIPDDLCVLHHCDNPLCCNPSHLWLGTRADNNHDMKSKGRARGSRLFGELHGRSKLVSQQVLEIRRLHQTGNYTMQSLSGRFGVDRTSIWCIINRKTWSHI